MKGVSAVFKKELSVTFASPIFYVATFIFLVVSGYFFYSNIAMFTVMSFQARANPFLVEKLHLSNMVVRPLFGQLSVILLLMLPLITMRSYAEEKRLGTIELLFTYPISDAAALTGKFLAAMFILLAMLVGTIPSLFLLEAFGNLDWGSVLSGYLGIFLMGTSFLSVGIFCSSLTENQIVAAALSFGALLLFWLIGWAKLIASPAAAPILDHLSIITHLDNFTKGLVDTRDVVFYLLFSFFWLFLTLRFLSSRFWRG